MEVIKVNLQGTGRANLRRVVAVLKSGGVVAHPTETAYGFAVDATNPQAIQRLQKLKCRAAHQSFAVIVADLKMAQKVARFTPLAMKLAKKYWPGPLTMILPQNMQLPSQLAHKHTIGLRVPGLELARELVRACGRPLVSTSANLSGAPTTYSSQRIFRDFRHCSEQPDLMLDAGVLSRRKPSTIIQLTTRQPQILRTGSIHLPKTYVYSE